MLEGVRERAAKAWLALRIVAVAVLAEVLLNEPALTRCSDMLTGRPEEQQCWRLYPRVGAALPPGR